MLKALKNEIDTVDTLKLVATIFKLPHTPSRPQCRVSQLVIIPSEFNRNLLKIKQTFVSVSKFTLFCFKRSDFALLKKHMYKF